MPELPEVETSKRYIEQYLLNAKKSRFDVVCKASLNYWNNRQNLQLILLDLKVLN